MNFEEELDELKTKVLCSRCVGDTYLSAEINQNGDRQPCSYCERVGESYTIEEVANRIDSVFRRHFVQTFKNLRIGKRSGNPIAYAIANAAKILDTPAEDIRRILETWHFHQETAIETGKFTLDSWYKRKEFSDHYWQREWQKFERTLKTEERFFSRTAAAVLGSVFKGIEAMSSRDGRALLLEAGPGRTLLEAYRARVFQSEEALGAALVHPHVHLGPPPATLAKAGRMNPLGVAVFYGANAPGVAIAEVRPPVGSRVAVARFEIIRQLRLLDLTALSTAVEDGSVFDRTLASRLERATFLRTLSDRITRPVMPNDEAFDYLPTQAVADFLATENMPPLDGILFPSTQAAGPSLNLVLFHRASRVEVPQKEGGSVARLGDEYYVSEATPADETSVAVVRPEEDEKINKTLDQSQENFFDDLSKTTDDDAKAHNDDRKPALRIDLDSIRVYAVRRAEYETVEYRVSRHPDIPF